jgi:hypothetical protein
VTPDGLKCPAVFVDVAEFTQRQVLVTAQHQNVQTTSRGDHFVSLFFEFNYKTCALNDFNNLCTLMVPDDMCPPNITIIHPRVYERSSSMI